MFPLPINIYFEIAALITSVIFWRSLRTGALQWLPIFLFFIVTVELSARYLFFELYHKSNGWIYNISVPIEYLFYSFLFRNNIKDRKYKKPVQFFLFVFPVFVSVSLLFLNGFIKFNSNFLKVGSLTMIVFSLLYFFDILSREELVSPLRVPFFWITTGLFIFNVGEFAYVGLSDILFSNWLIFRSLVKEINNNLIFVLYTSIIIGILVAKWVQGEKI